jgi:hypothetical protein
MKTLSIILFFLLIGCASYCADKGDAELPARITALEKELLPTNGTPRADIEQLWGKATVSQGEDFHTESGVIKKLQRSSYLLIPHYWLYVSYDDQGRCYHARFGFNDPRVAWALQGHKEYSMPEHAKRRLAFLENLKARRKEEKKSRPDDR